MGADLSEQIMHGLFRKSCTERKAFTMKNILTILAFITAIGAASAFRPNASGYLQERIRYEVVNTTCNTPSDLKARRCVSIGCVLCTTTVIGDLRKTQDCDSEKEEKFLFKP